MKNKIITKEAQTQTKSLKDIGPVNKIRITRNYMDLDNKNYFQNFANKTIIKKKSSNKSINVLPEYESPVKNLSSKNFGITNQASFSKKQMTSSFGNFEQKYDLTSYENNKNHSIEDLGSPFIPRDTKKSLFKSFDLGSETELECSEQK